MSRSRISTFVAACFLWFGLFTSAEHPAQAVTCPAVDYDFLQNGWSPSDGSIAGFRSSIELRKNGSVCSPDGFASPWVGVQSNTNGGISQIGWDHESSLGYCRFWEYNDGHGYDSGPIDSRCGTDAAGAVRFYQVEDTYVAALHQHYYSIYDCGTADWSSCGELSGGPVVSDLGSVNAVAASEVDYGGTACTNDMMGTQTNPTNWGGNTIYIKGQKDFNGSWAIRSLSYSDLAGCGEYKSPLHTDGLFQVYDSNT
jgi:hypothetical protein